MRLARRQLLKGSVALALARCAAAPRVQRAAFIQGNEPVYVIATGWHTEIGLPAARITSPLAALRSDFPAADTLEFGWGEQEFYMNPDPSIADMLRAAVPGPSVMLVRPLDQPPPAALGAPSRVVTLLASSEGFSRICDYVWGFIARDAAGQPRRIGPGPYGFFYASDGTYDLAHTCNTWTAEVLQAGGFPVHPDGVITADGVMDQIA